MRFAIGPRESGAWVLLPLAVLTLGLPAVGTAQMTLVKSVQSGGAVEASGGSYRLLGTVGEAGVIGLTTGTAFTLSEGFWSGYWVVHHVVDAPTLEESAGVPIRYVNSLRQNAPNPFRGSTSIHYTVGGPSPVRLQLYDVAGRRLATLAEGSHDPGLYRVDWDGRDGYGNATASGVYFVRLHIGDWSKTRKLLKLR